MISLRGGRLLLLGILLAPLVMAVYVGLTVLLFLPLLGLRRMFPRRSASSAEHSSPHAPAVRAGGGPRPVTSRISRSSSASAFRSAVASATSLSRCAVSRRVASPWHSSTIAPHLGVDQLGGRLAVGLALEGGREPVVLRGHEADRADLLAYSPAQHHLAGDLGDLRRSFSPPVATTA